MTHDELKATINNLFDKGFDAEIKNALHAVVELHKSDEDGDCSSCVLTEDENGISLFNNYPCSTIQAITEKLG